MSHLDFAGMGEHTAHGGLRGYRRNYVQRYRQSARESGPSFDKVSTMRRVFNTGERSMKIIRFVVPPMQDEAWLCHVRSVVLKATQDAFNGGRAMTLRAR